MDFEVERCEGGSLDKDADGRRVTESVRQAIESAVQYGEQEGHLHPLSDEVSVLLEDSRAEDVTAWEDTEGM